MLDELLLAVRAFSRAARARAGSARHGSAVGGAAEAFEARPVTGARPVFSCSYAS